MDRDGTRAGFDNEMTAAVSDAVNIRRSPRAAPARRPLRRRVHGRPRGRGPRGLDLPLRRVERHRSQAPSSPARHSCPAIAASHPHLMLIPSIDLQRGAVVQLVQGDKLAIRAADSSRGSDSRLPPRAAHRPRRRDGQGRQRRDCVVDRSAPLSCRWKHRSVERARAVLGAGAHAVIASSALFRDGGVDVAFAKTLADAVGPDRYCRRGQQGRARRHPRLEDGPIRSPRPKR